MSYDKFKINLKLNHSLMGKSSIGDIGQILFGQTTVEGAFPRELEEESCTFRLGVHHKLKEPLMTGQPA